MQILIVTEKINRDFFFSPYFFDKVHLNGLGGQLHANDLKWTLNNECWW
jgi:hypothetical protein